MVGVGMIFEETYWPMFQQVHAEGLFRRDTGLVEVELAALASRTVLARENFSIRPLAWECPPFTTAPGLMPSSKCSPGR